MNAIKTYHNTHLFHIQCSSKLLCSVSVARCFSRAPNSCRSQPDLADNQNKLLRSIILSELTRLGKVFPKNPVFLDLGLTVPKRPKNLFFEIWSIYIVIIYENEALGLEKNKKIFLEFFAIFGPPF